MSEPSEEITDAMPDVPPQEIANAIPAGPNYSFYLKMKPLRTLSVAIIDLLDPTFKDDDGFGIVGATTESLVISVENRDMTATAALFLKSAGMIEFRYNTPLPSVGLLAPLDFISQGLPRNLDGDDDTVTIFHVHGTNRLCFDFETAPASGFWTQIVEIPDLTLFPPFTVLHETTVPVNDIREMIYWTLHTRDLVNIDWEPGFATFEIGSCDKKWEYDYSQNEDREPTGLRNGDIYQAQFNWSYTRLMTEVSLLADRVGVKFLTFPEQHILFQFHMGELADLKLIKKAVLEVPDMDTDEDA